MGPYAGVDYELTLCPLKSRLHHIYHGQPLAKVDLNPQSGTLDVASGSYIGYSRENILEEATGFFWLAITTGMFTFLTSLSLSSLCGTDRACLCKLTEEVGCSQPTKGIRATRHRVPYFLYSCFNPLLL
jgi:hypothetical protein